MTEIGCKKCTSPDCKGCNTFILETALKQGRFDALMDGNKTLRIAADVRENVKGKWVTHTRKDSDIFDCYVCSNCGNGDIVQHHFCMWRGAEMVVREKYEYKGAKLNG